MSASIEYCYVVEGACEKALEILEAEIASGLVLFEWWRERMVTWWALLEDDLRYQETARYD